MKKSTISLLLALLLCLSLVLTGCGCKHEWEKANCEDPKTCELCGETEGDAKGHDWKDATCEEPKTCSECKKTSGEALGHTWVDATCEKPKTCSVCNKTEGETAEHTWEEATTEAPKTCSVCQKTEGEKITTDSRFKTSACKDLIGTWEGTIDMPGESFVDVSYTHTVPLKYTITFHNDGKYHEILTYADKDAFVLDLENFCADMLYAELEKQGLSKDQADAAVKTQFGKDVKEYAKTAMADPAVAISDSNLAKAEVNAVYYVADGKVYSGANWNATMGSDTYSITGDKLTIDKLSTMFPGLVFTKVTK